MKRITFSLFCFFVINSFSQQLFVPGGFTSSGIGTSANSNIGLGLSYPQSKLDVSGNIQISNASIPMGLMTEVGGTTPLLNMSLNFREPNKNTSYLGAAFRIDARSTNTAPLFQWLFRNAGGSEQMLMALNSSGNVGIGNMNPGAKLHINANNSNTQSGLIIDYSTTIDYSFGILLRTNRDLTRAFVIEDTRTSKPIFQVYGNGVVNTRRIYTGGIQVLIDPFAISWPDYVFNSNHKIMSTYEIEAFIKKNKHLPEVPSAKEVESGYDMAKMDAVLLKKIEELTLLIIDQRKTIDELKVEIKALENQD